jgi:alpha-tubulin suppressor-like RCC1 family protein
VTVSAVSDATNATLPLTLLGSNAVAFGPNFTPTPTQTPLVFPSPIVTMLAGNDPSNQTPTVRFYIALLANGTVWTTGTNAFGELGDGTTTDRSNWAMVPGLAQVTQVAIGWGYVVALRSDGTVLAWGRNHRGQVGDGTTIDRSSPTVVGGLPSNVTSIGATGGSGYAILSNGDLLGWGANGAGQLGIGTTVSSSTPVQVQGLPSAVRSFSGGWLTAFATLSDGSLWAWGDNGYGQVGDGTTTARSLPVNVIGLTSNVVQAAGGSSNGFALLSDGSVTQWGTSSNGNAPVPVNGLTSGVSSIFASANNLYAVLQDGSVKAWGSNWSGERGDGTTAYDPAAGKVLLPAGRTAVLSQRTSSAAGFSTFVLTAT